MIIITGDISIESKKLFFEAYQNDTVENSSKILLKFDKNCYINSGVLASLIDIASEGRKKAQKIHAYGLSDHFQKIFQMVCLTRCIPVFTSEEAAISDFLENTTLGNFCCESEKLLGNYQVRTRSKQ